MAQIKNPLFILFVFFIINPCNGFSQVDSLNYIFKSGTDGYKTFRIPAIVSTKSGRLLAFVEGRVNGASDTGNIDLVMKSSDNKGKTWGPLQVIWNDAENVCGNPAPVVDLITGEIHLLMTWNLGKDHERDIIDLKSKDTRRIFVCSSTDNGQSWSKPREITSSVKSENWTWYATGPCHGIQLRNKNHKNRLVIPCDHIEAGTKKYFSHIIYSDDHGKTWKLGGSTPQDMVNECTVAELFNGKLMLNMRNYDRAHKSRKVSISIDGGINWSDIYSDTTLTEPICQASMIYSNKQKAIFFLNPASETNREKMTLRRSTNDGKTWDKTSVLYAGPSAYSDLTFAGKKKLACLYEAGIKNPYEGIVFNLIDLK